MIARPLAIGGAVVAALFLADRAGAFGSAFGRQLAARAEEDVGRTAADPRVRALTAPLDPLVTDWCAAAVEGWIRETGKARGERPMVPGDPLAKTIMRQFKAAGAWFEASALRASPHHIARGAVAVWTRGDPSGPFGHTGIVTRRSGRAFWTIEGNNGPVVAEHAHDVDAPTFLGIGVWR